MDEVMKAELKRLEDEDRRLNKRVEILEGAILEIQQLTISVHALANDMKHMLEELREQGKRLDRLEKEPAENWKDTKKAVRDTVIGAFAGAAATGVIFLIAQSYR